MSKLEELIAELCPDGVEYKYIGEIANCYPGATPKTSKPEYWENGTIPWMSSGEVNYGEVTFTEKKITQLGYDNSSTKMVPANTVVIALAGQGKTRGTVAITRIPLCTNQSLCAIVTKENILSEFLLYFLRSQYQQLRDVSSGDGTRGGLNLKMINAYKVPVPPLPVQREIVRILDNFTELTAELTAELKTELTARKKQYEYYKNQILACDKYVEYRIDEICDICRGRVMSKGYINDNYGEYPVYSSQTENNGELGCISSYDFNGEYLSWTTDGANAGTVFYRTGRFSVTNVCGLLKVTNENIVPKFLYYILNSLAPSYVNKGMGNPKLMSNVMARIKIKIPDIEEQQRIVDILDRFDVLWNDISEGLPAEIKARTNQYEYYRDKLLTFKECEK